MNNIINLQKILKIVNKKLENKFKEHWKILKMVINNLKMNYNNTIH